MPTANRLHLGHRRVAQAYVIGDLTAAALGGGRVRNSTYPTSNVDRARCPLWVISGAKGQRKFTNVRFGSKADICSAKWHVRFTPKSGHVRCN